jgi:hypothetical protein
MVFWKAAALPQERQSGKGNLPIGFVHEIKTLRTLPRRHTQGLAVKSPAFAAVHKSPK